MRIFALVVAAVLLQGCSFIFVEEVPSPAYWKPETKEQACTEGMLWPIVDTLIATGATMAWLEIFGPENVEGLAPAALAGGGAAYGFIHTGRCRELRASP